MFQKQTANTAPAQQTRAGFSTKNASCESANTVANIVQIQ